MTKAANKRQRLVLLDAHAILHRAYHALPDFSAPTGEPTGALYGVVSMLLRIIEELKPDYLVACYDLPEPTIRHAAYSAYKAKREKTDDDLVTQIERSREIFRVLGIPIYAEPGYEADDVLGTIAATTKKNKQLQVIIASGDMDTMQCVDDDRVLVYTLKKGINDTILYDETKVRERFGFPPSLIPDYKGLRGDNSDNIPGIVGIGEKTATEIITNFGSLEEIYRTLKRDEERFSKVGIKPRMIKLLKENEEEALFSKMLATIETKVPIHFELPKLHWREAIDVTATLNLFSELGFRTLSSRVKSLLEIRESATTTAANDVNPEEVSKASILLWLLESERTNATYEDIVDYGRAFYGTDQFSLIFDRLYKQVAAEASLKKVYEEIELPLIPVLNELSQTGIKLDVPYLERLGKTMHAELETLEADIYKLAGTTFNINSPKQLSVVLFDTLGLKPKNQKKTALGQRSTKESELEKIKAEHPVIPVLLRYRELQKLVSTYVDALPQGVSRDGRIRTTFLQTGTTTGRLSSRDPNLQNIPTRTDESRAIRRAFVASPDRVMVAIDYSQIELRIAAIMSHDAKLLDIFKRGEDVHTGVAVRVFGVGADEVTSEMRRKAKVINFGILYGMGVNALRTNLGADTSREEAQSFLNAYFNTFTRLADYLEETKLFARQHGYTETLFGRRRHFPGIRSSAPFIKAQAERMAINAPIQGTAADIIRLAMSRVATYLKQENLQKEVKMLLQVHDELIFEMPAELLERVVPNITKVMTGILSVEENYGVPLGVKVAVGQNWADVKEWSSNA